MPPIYTIQYSAHVSAENHLPHIFLYDSVDDDPDEHVEEYVEQVPNPVQVHGLGLGLGVHSTTLAICKGQEELQPLKEKLCKATIRAHAHAHTHTCTHTHTHTHTHWQSSMIQYSRKFYWV